MININNISLQRGNRILFSDATLVIHEKQRVGLIGANGAGKSSLFAMILGQLEIDRGEFTLSPQLRVAHVAQETPPLDTKAIDYVIDGDKNLRSLESQLLNAEEANDGELIAHYHTELAAVESYSAASRAASLLAGLGFSEAQQHSPVKSFSGGWRMRLNLAQALMMPSDLLLLDEPTNHLDIDAVLWLEDWLSKYPGTMVLISHDRDFLDRVVTHIAHLTQKQFTLYKGNYSSFEQQLAENLRVQQAGFEKQQKQVAHLQSFIDRFKAKATKAKQAQSRIKMLEKMQLISAVQANSEFRFKFYKADKLPNPLMNLSKADLGYGEKVILRDVNLSLGPDTRVGLLGLNGAGKSTLLKCLCGDLPALTGEVIRAEQMKLGYFAQHQLEQLDVSQSPSEYLYSLNKKATEKEIRSFLGGFAFTGDMALESMQHFSGGEKARAVLAGLIWQRPNVLLLDEPTNHLDLEMREALVLALQEYSGALILVSHDRHLIRSVCDDLILVAEGRAKHFSGDLDDYLIYVKNHKSAHVKVENDKLGLAHQENYTENAGKSTASLAIKQKIANAEKTLANLQAQLDQVNAELAEPAIHLEKNKDQLKRVLFSQAQLQKKHATQEQLWLNLCDDLEKNL